MTEAKGDKLKYAEIEVQKLLKQLKRYVELGDEIGKLSFSFDGDARSKRRLKEKERSQLSDDMKFQNPIIWLWYKAIAYIKPDGNPNECVEDFYNDTRAHQICGARLMFLEHHLGVKMSDFFGPKTKLIDAAKDSRLKEIMGAPGFMSNWEIFENLQTNGKADKWFTTSYPDYKEEGSQDRAKLLAAIGISIEK